MMNEKSIEIKKPSKMKSSSGPNPWTLRNQLVSGFCFQKAMKLALEK
jgi:hypothetical protein